MRTSITNAYKSDFGDRLQIFVYEMGKTTYYLPKNTQLHTYILHLIVGYQSGKGESNYLE